MSNLIGFDKLFDASSFDAGTKQLAKFLERITDEITKAEIAADDLTKALGTKLRQQIQSLASSSRTLANDIQNINNQMNQFQQTTLATQQVISNYQRENARLTAELNRLQNAQTQVNTTTSSTSTNFKGLTQSLLGVASGAALVHQGIQFLKDQLVLAVKSTIEFEKIMKEVQAVSGATGKELELLTANANKLGATTEKTAQQIAEAQKELAKLGFTTPEILLATKAIVDLSTATGEDLVKSAVVAAATVRSFGLDVDQLGRVTDVMTKSFVISALDLEKFRESMKLVAPIATSANIGIEAVTAALAKLSDTGISGSLSGTAMRNLLGSMADPTEKLTKYIGRYDETLKDGIKSSEDFTRALKVLKGANVSLEEAVQMVDKRAQSAFFTLVNYADDVEYLALELEYLDNETSKVAETMRDQLANDINIAASAFDSLRRNAVEPLIPVMRQVTQEFTQIIEALRLSGNSFGEWFRNLKDGTEDELNIFEKMLSALIYDLEWLARPFTLGADKAFNAMVESNDIAKLTETFNSLSTNVGKIIDDFEKFDNTLDNNELAIAALEAGVANAKPTLEILRDEFKELSHVTNDEDFLKLVIGQTNKAIKNTYGHIEALKSEQQTLEDHKKILLEKAKNQELSNNESDRLRKIESAIIVVQNLRFDWEERLIKVREKSGQLTQEEIKDLEKQIELNKKLAELRGQLGAIYAKSAEEQAKFAFEEEQDFVKKSLLLIKYRDTRLSTISQQLNAELESLKYSGLSEEELVLKKKILYAKYAQSKLNIEQDFSKQIDKLNDKRIKDEEKFLKKINQIRFGKDSPKKRREERDKELADDFKARMKKLTELNKAEKDLAKKNEQDIKKSQEQKLEDFKKYADVAADTLLNLAKFNFDNRQIERENELRAIEKWEDEQLRIAGDNENAKLRIQEQADAQRAEIKRKQAQDDKKEALFQIFIRTAMGVMSALAALPPNPVLAAIIGATGALQLATVASRPLPAFAKGTDNSPEGFAQVGERGRELVRDGKTGTWSITPDKTTVAYLTKGSQVIPNAQTEMILKNDPNVLADNYLKNKVVQVNTPQLDYNKIGEQFERSISKIPINITNFDQNGVANFVIKKSVKLRRLNKRY